VTPASFRRPVPLQPGHDCSEFDCGNDVLNTWLLERAKGNQQSRASRTFAVTSNSRVVGYYGLSSSALARREATTRVARNMPDPIPAILLGRLAVDLSVQGAGLGKGLLRDAMLRTLQVAEHSAVRALSVHAIDRRVRDWYGRHGFEPAPTGEMDLMVRVDDIWETLGPSS
jgi:predicted GNAT family N-acyltransferase